ncbi:YEATS family [Phytophthora infestans]|uniref:YEATS family n=1 Tax=Phytophthora infestans TaxID=4787 RepID=A0A833TGF6_PHYIN|nr:YEATS family [Phytophthora infestans]
MSDARQKNVVVSKPILYGSVATYLGRKAEETKTHRWSIYLRGVDDEDLSYMISKVVISLHVSFANPVREPPYEVTELGWGEFETRIQIYFHDPNERPISIIHLLVLYPPNSQPASTKKPVVSEFYDELVFNEPTEFFYKKLMAGPDRQSPPLTMQDHLPTYSDVEVLKTLARAENFVQKEIKELKERIAEHTKKKKQADKLAATHTTICLQPHFGVTGKRSLAATWDALERLSDNLSSPVALWVRWKVSAVSAAAALESVDDVGSSVLYPQTNKTSRRDVLYSSGVSTGISGTIGCHSVLNTTMIRVRHESSPTNNGAPSKLLNNCYRGC